MYVYIYTFLFYDTFYNTFHFIFQKWSDEFLKWNPVMYDGLTDFFFDSGMIWIPEISSTSTK